MVEQGEHYRLVRDLPVRDEFLEINYVYKSGTEVEVLSIDTGMVSMRSWLGDYPLGLEEKEMRKVTYKMKLPDGKEKIETVPEDWFESVFTGEV